MKIGLHWLKDWVDTGDDVPALAHALTMAGLEIEGIHPVAPSLSGVVVGEILAVEMHPNARRLSVCRVAGGGEPLQIVCGAPNVRAGMKAPLALVGAVLPGGMRIAAAALRGVESAGMLCSARELGLSEESSGLMELPMDLVTGQDLVKALALDDTVLEINLTPNRGDCMSIAGVAREVAACRRQSWRPPAIASVEARIQDRFEVRLEAPQACPKFVSRIIRGIRSEAKSPLWMQERLRRAGLRPIGAVVDITNYVMLEMGQPMHAYDLAHLEGAIVVRHARAGEALRLLDERIVELTPDVLVIADDRKLLGMAGVMGGADSGIGAATQDVFLEVAFFEPDAIAGRGRRRGLITDASQRFERGVDPQLQERAIERATALLLEHAGGLAGPVSVTRGSRPAAAVSSIPLRHARVEKVLGMTLAPATVAALLESLGMQLEETPGPDRDSSERSLECREDTLPAPCWQVRPPSWRFDLHIEEDLIEEIARLVGFDRIPERAEQAAQQVQPWTETRLSKERAADALVDRGYQEAITYAFTDSAFQAALLPGAALALRNPISAELAVMRISLWPGLIQAAAGNQRRQQSRLRLFEVGRCYAGDTGAETEVIAGIASGAALPEQWGTETSKLDFFDVKADLGAVLALTGASHEFRFVAQPNPALHPGQSARILRREQPVGWLGALHPAHLDRLDLTYPVFVFELETQAGLAAAVPEFVEISKYPAIRRDIAVIIAESLPVEVLLASVRSHAGSLLKTLTILSVYRGKQIENGKKSIALGLHLQDTSRTLTDDEADTVVTQVIQELGRELDATIRDK
ncbi:phenylalanyl-tRNA synthetase beta chain [Steroidobacter denitrificans]|uniref:Phenylalanine--tRNA ligase beta subunit n=1 Tax=Steroidobacter denitrificans TaxID=465721 RepID=A0A127F8Z2_STEDE|nr:phenylalanine--tRNA ligase subunit beta [Steroidobacter denitrificans]AMN46894.1 phenylalanyl-tRNA synthetase beta chain [Steroidobacter denitrificans]